jgi:hypothetical protein
MSGAREEITSPGLIFCYHECNRNPIVPVDCIFCEYNKVEKKDLSDSQISCLSAIRKISKEKNMNAPQDTMEGVPVHHATQQGTQAAKEKDAASGHC